MTPRVYSYLRFSDPKQSAGSSADRQTEYARKWAAERGLVLDESLSMRDEGLSAYHQRHVKSGALGVFLVAVDEGRIAPGSVLIVEGLDRLSRAEPIQAQAQLAQIINAGITVVTASDGREYNRAGLKAQPMDLVYSLLVMIRAHEESDTKSKRVKAAIRRQCDGWIAGTYRGVIRNGKDPAWVRWTGERFELVPERAEAMRLAVSLFRRGDGSIRIARELSERGLSITGGVMVAQNLYRTFRLPALIGVKTIELDGEEYRLSGYYPALLSDEEYSDLQALAGQRFRRRGRGEIPGIITGLNITTCGYCGASVVGQNLMGRKKKEDGTPHDGHRRLICCGHAHGPGCTVGGSVSVVPVERAILTYCADQFRLTSLLSGDDATRLLQARLAATRTRVAELEKQIERITTALLESGDVAPLAFARKARELETTLASEQATAADVANELALAARRSTPALAEAWAAIADGALALDEDARLRARQLVADTFDQIVIYHRGTTPDAGDGKTLDMVLISKSGTSRALRVDRKSGVWRAAEQWGPP